MIPNLRFMLLQLADRLVQLLLPLAPRKICYASTPDYTDNTYYMYRHVLLECPARDHVWLVTDVGVAEWIRREFDELALRARHRGHTLRVVPRRSIAGYFHYLTSPATFHTHGLFAFSTWAPRRRVVCLWHGMPIKCIDRMKQLSPKPTHTFGTDFVATSHFFRFIIAASFGANPAQVLVCDQPRCDVLRHTPLPADRRGAIRAAFGAAADEKLILWLPTHRLSVRKGPGAPPPSFLDDLPPWMLPALDRLCAQHRCRIVAKLHPYDALNAALPPSWPHERIALVRSPDWQSRGFQLYDVLAASDALLSDISSVIIDYLLTRRPIGVLGFDPTVYNRELNFPVELLLRSRRFHNVTDAPALERLFDLIRAGAVPPEPNDVAELFNETFPGAGAAAIARRVGLASPEPAPRTT